jgi:hypothetical protein
MPREASAADSHSTVKDQAVDLYKDLEHEVKHEVHNPLDSSQGDLLVRKHINGLAISFFILIAISVFGVIVGYAMYTHY